MKSNPEVNPIPVVICSYLRPNFIRNLVPLYDRRTFHPHRIIVAHGSPENGQNEAEDRECRQILNEFKVKGIIDDVYYASAVWDRANPGQGGLQDMALEQLSKEMPDAEYVVFSQTDLEPPDMKRVCWLSRMVHLMEKYGDEYAAIAARIEVTPRLSIDESEDLIDSRKSIPSVGRIMRMDDIRAMGPKPFGARLHWESLVAAGQIEKLGKKQAFATRIFFSHRGYMPNKGYSEEVKEYHTNAPNKEGLYEEKPYPKIMDDSTLEPLPNQTDYKFHREEFGNRDKFWNEDIGIQADGTIDSPRRQTVRKVINEIFEKNPGRYLDVGCGAKKVNDAMDGLDMWPYECANYIGDAFDPWFIGNGEYDGVVSSHVLEHFKGSPKDALRAWDRILKPGGLMVFVVPDGENRPSTICEPSHAHAFSKEVLRLLMKRVMGYEVIRCDNVDGLPENKKDIIVVARKPDR